MSDRDFQLEVIEGLTELRTDVRAVKEHLKTLNGKVLAHEKELSERRGAENAAGKWISQIAPISRYALGIVIGALAILVLNHAHLFSSIVK